MTVFVIGFKDVTPIDAITVNTTSNSTNWSKGLSPFYLGPVDLYDGFTSRNVENAWQFSKVYPGQVNLKQNPNQDYLEWAKKGWNDTWAHRYPMGKGAIPLYSYWDREKLSYIQARKKIYIPLYRDAVIKSEAWTKLKKLNDEDADIYLKDYDGYNHKKLGMSYDEVINLESKKMGHAFVLAMMLDRFDFSSLNEASSQTLDVK